MSVHIIENGIVVNTILATVAEARAAFPLSICVDASVGGKIGDSWDGEVFTPALPPPAPNQFDLDQARYQKRAAVKDELIAFMAADNMGRVRSGQWTVAELTGLMTDPDVSSATSYMGTLSYELAAQAIANAQTPLLTPEIKSAWVSKLQEHFYLTP